ncbi:hypothetical protein CS8_070040 [Cupriavidus sp. 8B]
MYNRGPSLSASFQPTTIHLLKTFIDADQRAPHIIRQVIIHLSFLLSAVAMAYVNKLVSHPAHPAQSGGHQNSQGTAH